MSILTAAVSMAAMGTAFGAGLLWASKKFAVETDPRIEKVEEALPGANCGACGQAGCRNFAEGVVAGNLPVNGCPVGGDSVASAIAEILGKEAEEGGVRKVALIKCGGGCSNSTTRAEYDGVEDCRAAQLIGNGNKGCSFGCLGLGTCAKVCPFDAITMSEEGLPVVDWDKCTACGKCVAACPRNVIELVPVNSAVHVLCNSTAKGREVRSVCQVGCIGCRACTRVCPTGAITVTDNLASIDYSKCTNCGACVGKCPTKAIESKIVFEDVDEAI